MRAILYIIISLSALTYLFGGEVNKLKNIQPQLLTSKQNNSLNGTYNAFNKRGKTGIKLDLNNISKNNFIQLVYENKIVDFTNYKFKLLSDKTIDENGTLIRTIFFAEQQKKQTVYLKYRITLFEDGTIRYKASIYNIKNEYDLTYFKSFSFTKKA